MKDYNFFSSGARDKDILALLFLNSIHSPSVKLFPIKIRYELHFYSSVCLLYFYSSLSVSLSLSLLFLCLFLYLFSLCLSLALLFILFFLARALTHSLTHIHKLTHTITQIRPARAGKCVVRIGSNAPLSSTSDISGAGRRKTTMSYPAGFATTARSLPPPLPCSITIGTH